MNEHRWLELMQRMDMLGNLPTFRELTAAYAEKHRQYHTATHIADCLEQLDVFGEHASHREDVELAIWFHDAIYRPSSTINELKSAEWAYEFLTRNAADPRRCKIVHAHIMATMHTAAPGVGDTGLLVDIDLSILGRDAETYRKFEENVRKEYRWVPSLLFRRKRADILRSFLERDSIYVTPAVRDRYEMAARGNLQQAIERLVS